MTPQMETPGALAGAAEGSKQVSIHNEYSWQRVWASVLWDALEHCDPADVLHACETALAELETGGPTLGDPFGTVTGDALIWADCAPAHELAAYATAALDRLRQRRIGLAARKKLFFALWQSLEPEHRLAFLERVRRDEAAA